MKKVSNSRGFTLIEIIVSIAILGIVLVAFLSIFTFGFSNIAFSGQKSGALMELQTIVDDLNAERYISRFDDDGDVTVDAADKLAEYLSDVKGYNQVANASDIYTENPGTQVNFFVSSRCTRAEAEGYIVTLVSFTDNGKRYSELSTFAVDWGY